MSIENLDMIQQHLIRTRRQNRLGAFGILLLITLVLAALVTTI
jgi:hypothetical protein